MLFLQREYYSLVKSTKSGSIDYSEYKFSSGLIESQIHRHIESEKKPLAIRLSFTEKKKKKKNTLTLRASELGNGFGSFRNGVLGKLPGQHQPDRGLNLPGGNSRLLVVPGETRRFLRELLEDVVDEAVHDPHGLARNTDVRVYLLQHLEDIDLVGLHALLRPLLLLLATAFLRNLFLCLRLLLRRRLLSRWLLLRSLRHSQKWREYIEIF